MTQDSIDLLRGAPWYVRAAVYFGAPYALLALLMYYYVTSVSATQTQIIRNQELIIRAESLSEQTLGLHVKQMDDQTEVMRQNNLLLRYICANSAKSRDAQQMCFEN